MYLKALEIPISFLFSDIFTVVTQVVSHVLYCTWSEERQEYLQCFSFTLSFTQMFSIQSPDCYEFTHVVLVLAH